jgi:hypothetical protein
LTDSIKKSGIQATCLGTLVDNPLYTEGSLEPKKEWGIIIVLRGKRNHIKQQILNEQLHDPVPYLLQTN